MQFFENLPPETKQFLLGVLGFLPTAALARFLVHNRLVRLGKRAMLSPQLWIELPTAVFSAIIGGGIAQYYGLGVMESHAVVGVCGWLGPHGLEAVLSKWTGKR